MGARIFSGSFRPPPLAVVARSPDRATRRDRRSPGKVGRGDLRSKAVAWSGDRATTRAAESVFPPQFATLPESAHAPIDHEDRKYPCLARASGRDIQLVGSLA